MLQGKTSASVAAIASLERLVAIFLRRRQRLAATADLTELQWQTLESVGHADCMPSLFARARATTPAAVSKVLRQLLDRALVESTVSPTDGRQRTYALTPAGAAALATIEAHRADPIEATWAQLPRKDLEAFERTAARLAAELERYDGEGG